MADKTMADVGAKAAELMNRYVEQVGTKQTAHLDFLARAFLEEVGAPPSECELVQVAENLQVRWFFRKREQK